MKKLALVALCLVIVCAFAACSNENNSSKSEPEPELPTESSDVDDIEDASNDLDYDALIESLGPMLANPGWESPQDIPVKNLIAWYAYTVKNETAEDEGYMDRYLAASEADDDSEGVFHFPASELEDAVKDKFGLGSSYLREDIEMYDEEAGVYMMSAGALETATYEFQLIEVRDGGAAQVVIFNLSVDGAEPVIRALSMTRMSTTIQFGSYTDENGSVFGEVAETAIDGESSEESEGDEGPNSDEAKEKAVAASLDENGNKKALADTL